MTTLPTTGNKVRPTETEIMGSSLTFSNLHSKITPSSFKPTYEDVTIKTSLRNKDISTMISKTGSTIYIFTSPYDSETSE